VPGASDRAVGEIAKLGERLVVLLAPEALAGADAIAA
jgi:hypothetical protein